MINIGEILQAERKKIERSQQWVADKVHVSRAYYADIERGRYTPSIKVLSRLGVLFDLDLNFLKEIVENTRTNANEPAKAAV